MHTKPFKAIPIIDLHNLLVNPNVTLAQKKSIGKQIDQANREVGFFLIKNTGINF